MAELPLQNNIYTESGTEIEFDSLHAQFGKHYSQRAANGLNAIADHHTITWKGLTLSQKNQINVFARSVGTWDSFTWTHPTETTEKKYIITPQSKLSVEYVGKRFNMSCSISQVFDL